MRSQKRRGFLFGLLALVLAGFTGVLFTSQVAALQRQIGDKQKVVVVKSDVEPRALLTPEVLEITEIPRMWAHPTYIQSIEDIANQRVAVVPLTKGQIVRQADVAPTNGLDDGFRAVSIGVNPVAVLADRVGAGSRVDVVVSYETSFLDQQGSEVKEKRTKTLLSDVEVLAVVGTPTQPVARAQSEADSASAAAAQQKALDAYQYRINSVVIATLKVAPQDAQLLAYMDTYATDIRLALRRPDDRAIEALPPISEEDFR